MRLFRMLQDTIPSNCQSCAIRHRALCSVLEPAELVDLNAIARFKSVKAGQPIASPLDAVVSFSNIVSGVVTLTKVLSDGRAQIVGLQFATHFLGQPFRQTCTYFAQAATDVQLCTFSKTGFENLLAKFPSLEHRFLEHTLDELDAAREWMLLLGRKTAREKVASFLFMTGNQNLDVGCSSTADLNFAKFELPLTRTDIADFLGLTMETVSRQMSKFKSEGIIRLEGGRTVVVPDLKKLEAETADT